VSAGRTSEEHDDRPNLQHDFADAVASAEAGAGHIGVVVAEPGIVPEGISAEAAHTILAAIRPPARHCAVAFGRS
jgi:hypothetical protein